MELKEITLSGSLVISLIKSSISNFKMRTKKKKKSWTIKCGVPQGLLLWPLLFIVYVDNTLKPVMFANDQTLTCTERHIKTLFQTAKHWIRKNSNLVSSKEASLNWN